ncbi:MAG: ABC transporter ATP-binding protein [Desulfosarcinaceae bacterium]|nr:ABC transporter ATP-binding protein [Desulfosarcinaceae bacterium]
MISLTHLTKVYGRTTAVDDLNLEVGTGELFGFIGPNGAGKTTTIKMMTGLLAPTRGGVRINGFDMARQPESAKQEIGFIPDRPYLYEKLTGREFLSFIGDLYGVAPSESLRRAERWLTSFGLAEWGHELVEAYSHGMKQRLIMSAALLHEPRVLVVDEPMVGLDPSAIVQVKTLFRQLTAKGTTIFMSTHTLQVAEDLCDRIGVLHRGRLIALGSPEELRRQTVAGATEIQESLEAVFMQLTAEAGSADHA